MAAALWSFSGLQQVDLNGKPLVGARAYFYDASTTTPIASGPWQDIAMSSPHQNPVQSDGNGRFPDVFLDGEAGFYGLRITTAQGVQFYASATRPMYGGGGDGGSVIIEGGDLSTGDTFFSMAVGNRTGYVRANGRTIGNASSGATERAATNCQALFEFLWAKDTDLFAVAPGRGASAAADWAANKTITLPDLRARAPVGANSMGAGNSGRLSGDKTTNVPGSGVDVPGTYGGVEHVALTAPNQLPPHNHTIELTAEAEVSGGVLSTGSAHKHDFQLPEGFAFGGSGTGQAPRLASAQTGAFFETETDGAHTHGHDIGVAVTVEGTIGDRGASEPHSNMQPFLIGTWYIML